MHTHLQRAVFQSLNDALGTLGMRVTAPSGRYDVGDWSISDGRSLQRFADGMKMPAKGVATTGRAQQLLHGMHQLLHRPGQRGAQAGAPPPPTPAPPVHATPGVWQQPGTWQQPTQMGSAAEPEKARGSVFSRLGGLSDVERRLQAQGRLA